MKKLELIVIFFVIILITQYCNISEPLVNISNNKKIPYIIFKTGPDTTIPDEINNVINNSCLNLNCEFKYFDDMMCNNFIKNNFSDETLIAYNTLIPTAYKADMWRYCVLYINGGVYSDYSQEVLKPYDINKNDIDMLLVKDRSACNIDGIQISFMATKPKNNFLKFVIDNLTVDILNKRRGICSLDVTGPTYFARLFYKYFNINHINVGMYNLVGLDNNKYKIDIPFYMHSNTYINDMDNTPFIKNKIKNHFNLLYKNSNHYTILWRKNKIFTP